MKKLFLAAVAVMMTAFSVNAQVKVQSPHPDLDIKVTRCAFSSGTVIIDMIITNFGNDDEINLKYSDVFAYDDEGNAYSNSNLKILYGSPSKKLEAGFTSAPSMRVPQDIPLKYRVQLEGVSSQASKFTLLTIGFGSRGILALKPDKPVKIRNLDWVK